MKNQRTNIELLGIERNLSLHKVIDGSCEEVINLRKKDGSWQPVGDKDIYQEITGFPLLFDDYDKLYKHPVLPDEKYLGYIFSIGLIELIDITGNNTTILTFGSPGTELLKSLEFIGNIIVVCTDLNKYYLKYDIDLETYSELEELMVPLIQFEQQSVTVSGFLADAGVDFDSAKADLIEYLAEKQKEGEIEGHMLLRVAWKLFDGSYMIYSAPYHAYFGYDGAGYAKSLKYDDVELMFSHVCTSPGSMKYISTSDFRDNLTNWKGIVKSLVIFATRPVTQFQIGKDISNYTAGADNWQLPPVNPEIKNIILETNYYKIHEINVDIFLDTIQSDWIEIPFTGIDTLATQHTLSVDNFTAHKLMAFVAYNYNKRIHLGHIITFFSQGINLENWNSEDYVHRHLPNTSQGGGKTIVLSTYLSTSYGDKIVNKELSVVNWTHVVDPDKILLNPAIIYPDARAFKMELYYKDGADWYLLETWELTAHPFLNFSYFFNYYSLYEDIIPTATEIPTVLPPPTALQTESRYMEEKDRIQVSELNNPFVNMAVHSYNIGRGVEIVKLATQGEPLSEGQFGHFPITIFTSKGIWLLNQGTGEILYTSIIPLSREVCNNADSITETSFGIVYSADDGLKILSGRIIEEISQVVEGTPDILMRNNDDFTGLLSSINTVELYDYLSDADFKTFLSNAIIAYDHVEKEIIICDGSVGSNSTPDYNYSYVFNLRSKTWHKITDVWNTFIDNYPIVIGQTGAYLYNLTSEDYSVYQDVLIQTRPLKLNSWGLKKIKQMNLLCHLEKEDETFPSLLLFGSQDGIHWFTIQAATSDDKIENNIMLGRGIVGMKYFIAVFIGHIRYSTINLLEVLFDYKRTNKLR